MRGIKTLFLKVMLFNIIIILLCSIGVYVIVNYKFNTPKYEITVINLEFPKFLLSKDPERDLLKVLDYYNIQHPDIVYAQAVLETGYFKSNLYLENNNLFGLYDSKNNEYFKFDHWSKSVLGYINSIQYKYDSTYNNNYYDFLHNLGYAEDPDYNTKLKIIVNKNDKTRSTK